MKHLKKVIVCLLLALVFGSFFLYLSVVGIYEPLTAMLKAEPVTGTVVSRAVAEAQSTPATYKFEPRITYRYRYDGRVFTNDNLTPGLVDAYDGKRQAENVAERYPPGEEVTVYVLPETPEHSFLFKAAPSFWVSGMCLISLLFTIAGILGVAYPGGFQIGSRK